MLTSLENLSKNTYRSHFTCNIHILFVRVNCTYMYSCLCVGKHNTVGWYTSVRWYWLTYRYILFLLGKRDGRFEFINWDLRFEDYVESTITEAQRTDGVASLFQVVLYRNSRFLTCTLLHYYNNIYIYIRTYVFVFSYSATTVSHPEPFFTQNDFID